MNKPIASMARTKEILKKYDLKAKKGYGQNFLVDVSVVSRMAEKAHCQDSVIEIGPGIGALTEQLAQNSKKVLAYEVDERLLPVLNEELKEYDNVEVVLQDFLTIDLKPVIKKMKEEYGSCVVCANLPYYITTPVLFKLFEQGEDIDWITVMVQKEVGDRFSAKVGSKEYSALSVECQLMYDVKKLFNVSKSAFNPVPKVDSAIIQFHRLDCTLQDREGFFEFVKACFRQRRKTLYNNLKDYFQDEKKALSLINKIGKSEKVRPQELSVEEFVRMYEE